MSEQINDARRMADLFKGFSGGYGTYDARFLGKAEGKQKVHQFMVKEPPTIDLFEAHLSGQTPVGIYLLDDNEQVSFGAIDIDVYPIDLGVLANRLDQMSLPLIVCNSKSGGAHAKQLHIMFPIFRCVIFHVRHTAIVTLLVFYAGVMVNCVF
jgi:hypothetical protein